MEVLTDNGPIRCRKPNILEIYDYLDEVGSFREEDPIKLRGNMIRATRPYLDCSGLSGSPSFEDVMADADTYFKAISKISDDLYTMVIGVLSKKD